MDSFEKELKVSLLGDNVYSNLTAEEERLAKQAKRKAAGQKALGIGATVGGALGQVFGLGQSNSPAADTAPMPEKKKILGMQPTTFYMVAGGALLLTIGIIAVATKKK